MYVDSLQTVEFMDFYETDREADLEVMSGIPRIIPLQGFLDDCKAKI